MKHLLRAAYGRHKDHAIHASNAERSGRTQTAARAEQRSDGEPIWCTGGASVQKIHWWRKSQRDQPAYIVLCCGSAGAGSGHTRAHSRANALDGREGRTRIIFDASVGARRGNKLISLRTQSLIAVDAVHNRLFEAGADLQAWTKAVNQMGANVDSVTIAFETPCARVWASMFSHATPITSREAPLSAIAISRLGGQSNDCDEQGQSLHATGTHRTAAI
jgi:hypothetical protein